ncbi:MAG: hypothetical protein FWC11_01840 [Firmicutes bacterium]|nr:hypothetical protein [Bacillota bacterium]
METTQTTRPEMELEITQDCETTRVEVSVEAQGASKKPSRKKRILLILVPLALITLAILYGAQVIPTMVFTAILLSLVGIATIVVLLLLVKNLRAKKGIKKWVVSLAKIVPMIPALALYLAGVITSGQFVIIKAILLSVFIVFAITMLVINKRKSKKVKEQDDSLLLEMGETQEPISTMTYGEAMHIK